VFIKYRIDARLEALGDRQRIVQLAQQGEGFGFDLRASILAGYQAPA
jgi:hypothetical protein